MAIIPAEEKVFMVSNSTNTTYSGSAALKAMQQWYTMQDVANTVKPYKVFTALLTQSGGSNDQIINSGALTKGVTYYIDGSGGDFSNVGSPTSEFSTYFVATDSAVPNNWNGVDLSYNTGAPVATVLENTIGNVWFTNQGNETIGAYTSDSNGLFTYDKTFIINKSIPSGNADNKFLSRYFNEQVIFLYTFEGNTPADGVLNEPTSFEIRVYN